MVRVCVYVREREKDREGEKEEPEYGWEKTHDTFYVEFNMQNTKLLADAQWGLYGSLAS